jgi:hypothetical protein
MRHHPGVTILAALVVAASIGVSQTQAQGQGRPAPKPAQPNIVFISNEDMSPHLGVYGDAMARTPVLDRLARTQQRTCRRRCHCGGRSRERQSDPPQSAASPLAAKEVQEGQLIVHDGGMRRA